MKSIKRLTVLLVIMAVLISCFAFVSSAEFNEDDIENVLQYYDYPYYVDIDYDSYEAGKYNQHYTESGNDLYSVSFNRIDSENTDRYTIVDVGGNKMLQISDPAPLSNRYEINFAESTSTKLVTTLRYKTSADGDAAGSNLSLYLFAHDDDSVIFPNPKLRTVCIKCDSEDPANNSVTYLSIDKYGFFDENTVLEGFTPKLDTWYTIEAIYDLPADKYTLTITADSGESATVESSLGTLSYIDTTQIEVRCSKGATDNYTWIDDIHVYEGNFVRSPSEKNDASAKALLDLKALAETDIAPYTKARIANVLKSVVVENGYIPAAGTENRDAVLSAIEWAKLYINPAYFDAVINIAAGIDTTIGIYPRIDYYGIAAIIKSCLPATEEELLALNGIDTSLVDDVLLAFEKIEAEKVAIEDTIADSISFVSSMISYDKTVRDYAYIDEIYTELSGYTSRDATFIVSEDDDFIYPTVFDAEIAFKELSDKRNAMFTDATAFIEGVGIMKAANEGDFAELYRGYVISNAIYGDGVINENVDESTFAGLEEAIADYAPIAEYVESRIAVCEEFIANVERAELASFHTTAKQYVEAAYLYIDDVQDEYTVEYDYPGVNEAKTRFDALVELLTANVENAQAYVNAVNAINGAKTFNEKKSLVANALTYKEAGDVVGVAGVAEANIALSNAESEILAKEAASKTLIDTVALLKTAATLERRLEVINIAKDFVEMAEDSITGVTEAKAELNNAISSYNAEISALNKIFTSAIQNSVGIGMK